MNLIYNIMAFSEVQQFQWIFYGHKQVVWELVGVYGQLVVVKTSGRVGTGGDGG